MQDIITFGRRLVPLEQIAFIEPFDAARNPDLKAEREFKARVVLLNRDTVLAEANPHELAEVHGMRYLEEDNIAVNPVVAFKIEAFEATDDFKPERPFKTRLKWRDRIGGEQSKLLLASPETVIATVLRGEAEPQAARKVNSRRPPASRAQRRRAQKADRSEERRVGKEC